MARYASRNMTRSSETMSDVASEAHDIWMVRMSLIARTTREEPEDKYPGGRRALANRSAGTTGDP